MDSARPDRMDPLLHNRRAPPYGLSYFPTQHESRHFPRSCL